MLDPTWLPYALVFAAVCAAAGGGAALAVRLSRHRRQRRGRRVQRRGQRAERRAERLLQSAGFQVLERQVTATWVIFVDGQATEVSCRADLLVRKRRQRFVAEVKGAGAATRASHPATRRQLLEYTQAFRVDGVLLVDMARRRVHTVTFGGGQDQRS